MVFPSVPPYLNQDQLPTISIDNQPRASGCGNGDDASQLPKSMPERAKLAKLPQPEAALKCPRCGSTNTKFCYYNNYSLSQPRYFCKACRRYWTRGGNLRSVPVGGGCHRSKRSASSKSSSKRLQPTSASSSGGPTGATIPPAPSLASMAPNHLPFLLDNLGLTSISPIPPLQQQQPEEVDILFPLASSGRLGVSLEQRRSANMQHELPLWGMGGETNLPLPLPTQAMPPLIYHMDLEATTRTEEGVPLHMAGTRQPENAGGSGWTMTETVAAALNISWSPGHGGILFSGGGF